MLFFAFLPLFFCFSFFVLFAPFVQFVNFMLLRYVIVCSFVGGALIVFDNYGLGLGVVFGGCVCGCGC